MTRLTAANTCPPTYVVILSDKSAERNTKWWIRDRGRATLDGLIRLERRPQWRYLTRRQQQLRIPGVWD